eukprot:6211800-Pleurochrysis_carterae.AAC.2
MSITEDADWSTRRRRGTRRGRDRTSDGKLFAARPAQRNKLAEAAAVVFLCVDIGGHPCGLTGAASEVMRRGRTRLAPAVTVGQQQRRRQRRQRRRYRPW